MTKERNRPSPACGRVGRYTVAGFAVCEFDLPPGYRMDAHEHDGSGVVLPLAGRFRASVEGRGLDAGGHRVAILPAGVPHRERVGAGGSRCLLVVPEPDVRGGTDGLDLETPRSVERADLVRITPLLLRELREAEGPAPLVAESLLLELFASGPPGSTSPARGAPGWMGRALEVVRDRYAEPLEHAEIAGEVGVTREHLARTFRRFQGLPLGAYVRRIRLLEAARRLRESDRPVASIAARCGFADHSHLGRTFRRHFRLTPSEYRSRLRGEGRSGA